MKRLVVASAVVLSAGFLIAQAYACGGYRGGYRNGMWAPGGGYYANPGAFQGGDYQKFLDETAGLRNDLTSKEAEYDALMAQPNPDPKRLGELSKEIVQLQKDIQGKAATYGAGGSGPGGYWCRGPHPCGASWRCW